MINTCGRGEGLKRKGVAALSGKAIRYGRDIERREAKEVRGNRTLLFSAVCVLVLATIVGQLNRGAHNGPLFPKPPAVRLTQKGKDVKLQHGDWPDTVCNLVAKRQVSLGMTEDQVRAAWGEPLRINSEIGPKANQEIWWYGSTPQGSSLQFLNGRLELIRQAN